MIFKSPKPEETEIGAVSSLIRYKLGTSLVDKSHQSPTAATAPSLGEIRESSEVAQSLGEIRESLEVSAP